MYQVGSHLHIVNMENSFCLSFQKNSFKELDFLCIKLLANFFHPPYITEEISTQGSIPINDLLYCIQSGIYQFQQFVVRRNIFISHPLHHIRQDIQFRFYNSQIDFILTFKIGIKRSSTFFRSEGDIVHCSVLHPHLCEKLAGNVY